jgi:hypothetical protein
MIVAVTRNRCSHLSNRLFSTTTPDVSKNDMDIDNRYARGCQPVHRARWSSPLVTRPNGWPGDAPRIPPSEGCVPSRSLLATTTDEVGSTGRCRSQADTLGRSRPRPAAPSLRSPKARTKYPSGCFCVDPRQRRDGPAPGEGARLPCQWDMHSWVTRGPTTCAPSRWPTREDALRGSR